MIGFVGQACQQSSPSSPTNKVVPKKNSSVKEKILTPAMDKSPLDIIYFPTDYPVLKMSGEVKSDPLIRVIYSRPSKDGRKVFGNVVKYDSYWRLGANEATEIEFFTDVTINGKRVRKGRYIIYCIPSRDKWTIRLNDDLYTWGLKLHKAKDLYSFEIPVIISDTINEVFTMKFVPMEGGAKLLMAWDNVRASLPVKFN